MLPSGSSPATPLEAEKPSVSAGSIMIAGLKKVDGFVGDAIHQAVFLRDTA
jgi:hypothetical protein